MQTTDKRAIKYILGDLIEWNASVKIRRDNQSFEDCKFQPLTKELAQKIWRDLNIVEIKIQIAL